MAQRTAYCLKGAGEQVRKDLEGILRVSIPACDFKYGGRKELRQNNENLDNQMYGPLKEKIKSRQDGFLTYHPDYAQLFYDQYSKTVYAVKQKTARMSENTLKVRLAHEIGHHLLQESVPNYTEKFAKAACNEGIARLTGKTEDAKKYKEQASELKKSDEGFADWCMLQYAKEKLPRNAYRKLVHSSGERMIYPGNNIQDFLFLENDSDDIADVKLNSQDDVFEMMRKLAKGAG